MISSYKRGSDASHRDSQQRSGKRSFLGYRGRASYFQDRQRVAGRSTTVPSNKTEKDKALDKVYGCSVPLVQAGSLFDNLPKWRELTSDPWILQTVSGYRLEF